jgi:hypothetical protein
MPYLFRCDACGTEHDTGQPSLATEVAENCVSCGQDGCPACITDGLCDQCFERTLLSEDEDSVDGKDSGE